MSKNITEYLVITIIFTIYCKSDNLKDAELQSVTGNSNKIRLRFEKDYVFQKSYFEI